MAFPMVREGGIPCRSHMGPPRGRHPRSPDMSCRDSWAWGAWERSTWPGSEALKRLVCVKVLAIPEGEDPDLCRARFNREAELLASVSHPHIVSIFDFGTTADADLPFLVTEYIEGGDLRRRWPAGKPMPIDRVRQILSRLVKRWSISMARESFIAISSPRTFCCPPSLLCKVGDFGLAVMRDKSGTLTRWVMVWGPGLRFARAALRIEGGRASRPVLPGCARLRADDRDAARWGGSSLHRRWNPSFPRSWIGSSCGGWPKSRVIAIPRSSEFVAAVEPHLRPPRGTRLGLRLAAIGVLLISGLAQACGPCCWRSAPGGTSGTIRAVGESDPCRNAAGSPAAGQMPPGTDRPGPAAREDPAAHLGGVHAIDRASCLPDLGRGRAPRESRRGSQGEELD